jgi:hypothetical protein
LFFVVGDGGVFFFEIVVMGEGVIVMVLDGYDLLFVGFLSIICFFVFVD